MDVVEARVPPPPMAPRWAGLAVALFAILMSFPTPVMPEKGLDPAWMLATEHAAHAHLVFGRDYIFTYGPLAFLSTHLFESNTFGWVIAGELYLTLLFLFPLTQARSWAALGLYLVAACMAPFLPDSRLGLAAFGLLALTLRRRSLVTILLASGMAPFLIAKYSYAPVVLPLLALADAKHLLAARRIPVFLPLVLAATVLLNAAVGQPLSAGPEVLAALREILGGYAGAMQRSSSLAELLIVAVVSAAALTLTFWLAAGVWRTGDRTARLSAVALALGAAGVLFLEFRVGHVRQDPGHLLITWQILIGLAPMLVAALPAGGASFTRRAPIAAAVLLGVSIIGSVVLSGREDLDPSRPPPGRVAYAAARVSNLLLRPLDALSWLTPGRWAEAERTRRAGMASLATPFPPTVRGTVDVIPFELSPLIASHLDYHPRPAPQSYAAYTARLQALDAAFFADPRRAPETVLVKLGDIDGQLPTLPTGPTLPVLLRWYDPVGWDRLGAILHRRNAPRAALVADAGRQSFRLDQPVTVPVAAGAITLARITLRKTALGKLTGALLRDPVLSIELRFAGRPAGISRFVPGMAEAGFVLSPQPVVADAIGQSDPTPLFKDGGRGMGQATAFRIFGNREAKLAFSGGEVRFQTLRLSP